MVRLTGLNSGLDTESIIRELSQARQKKVDKVKGKQQKTEWVQDKWKDLNSKISKFYSSLDNLKYTSSYNSKKTALSDSSVASIFTSNSAPLGTNELEISQLASYANLTGQKIEDATLSTKLSDLGLSGSGSFEIKIAGKDEPYVVEYDENTTISQIKSELEKASLQVNFDSVNKRFYINAKESGQDFNFKIENDTNDALSLLGISEDKVKYNEGKNLKLKLNGVDYENNSNTVEINSLKITAQKVTQEPIQITTSQDTSGIYDTIKKFIKNYNELVKEIDKLYNAESAKDYDMLTDDEKDEMSEKQVEKWENKIKDSLLRKDESLGGVYNVFKNIMAKAYTMEDGTKLSLFNFGISTQGYFNSPENERYVYHIDGDEDDDVSSSKENKLKAFIDQDPDKITEFFSALTKDLHQELSKKSSSITNFRSYGSFYNDKQLKTEYDQYKTKIKEEEKKLDKFMDKYYKQFAAMEKALAKVNASQTSLTNFFGQ